LGEDDRYREILEGLFGDGVLKLDAQAEHELRHEDYVMEMPQSGEGTRGRETMRQFQEAYPNPPRVVLRRIVGSRTVWVMEATSDYEEGVTYHVADIMEFRDGRILKETRYYAEPFEEPAWRAEWVEKM
jgi:ketosteroid isomerase-like protein